MSETEQMEQQQILLESGTNEVEILEFLLGSQSFAINVAKVLQIMAYNPENLTKVPDGPESLLGVLLWRDQTISLIDLSVAINFSENKRAERPIVLVTEFNDVLNAFLTDGVNRIHRLSWDQINPTSSFLESFSSQTIGSIHIDKREILLVDFEHIIAELFPETKIEQQAVGQEIKETGGREGKKIILAEDSQAIRAGISSVLKKAGYTDLVVFENGEDAFNHIQDLHEKAKRDQGEMTDHVNLVITDIEMPQMDGLTLCRRFKTDLGCSHIPAVIFSSLINEKMVHKCKEVHADAFITKPQMGQLVDMMDGLLGLT